jgi:hypothetical protein
MKNESVSKDVVFWVNEIETYEQQFSPWVKRSKNIIKRFMDIRSENSRRAAKFNILWSNVQTLHPAIYASPPNPNIDRRFDNDDDIGRYSALVLERAVSYYVKNDLFDKVMKQTTLDRLLPGRGVAWVRYCPVFEEKVQITDDETDNEYENLVTEDVVPDYVHWEDFGHTWGRTWQEVRGVWRRAYMTRSDIVKRFGEEVGQTVPLDAIIKGRNGEDVSANSKSCIYEIWDKSKRKVYWLHKSMPDVLDSMDDPLGLKDFFPCPEPIYATISTDNLIPTPDYAQYQDQATELDMLTARIASITKAVKIAGVYDAAAEGVDRLLSEGVENKLIPVAQWAMLGGGKGIDGAISLFPLQEIMATLVGLYQAREQVKNDLYEITGISDIVRGQTSASETATAQKIKGQFATLRLDHNQKDVARFSKDLVVIMTEIIAQHFSLDTIKQVSGVKLLTAQEKQMLDMADQQFEQQSQQYEQIAQQAQQMGQQPPPPPQQPNVPEEMQELRSLPTWEEIEQLIRDDTARNFRIDIETDSTIKIDQDNERQSRVEFLGAVSSFMAQAVNVPPDLQELSMELLMFGVKGFKVSREIETVFEATLRDMKKARENPAPPPPNPEEIKAQAEQARLQSDVQLEQMKIQAAGQSEIAKVQMEDKKLQAETGKSQADINLRMQELSLREKEIAMKAQELQAKFVEAQEKNDIEREKIQADLVKAVIAKTGDEDVTPQDIGVLVSQALEKTAAMNNENISLLLQTLNRPKTVIRDNEGRVTGVQ